MALDNHIVLLEIGMVGVLKFAGESIARKLLRKSTFKMM